MDPARHERLAELFLLATEMRESEASAFLEEQCAGDPELLRLARALLEEDRRGPIVGDAGSADPLIGRTLSHYRIVGRIPGGGMAALYRAVDSRLERPVALKFLLPSLIANSSGYERFLREARAIASIDHPNVCPVYEVEEAEGRTFLAMAYLEGTPLSERIARGPLPVPEAVDIACQTARGLEAAHAKGLVHRDIKPANLMLVDTGSRFPLARILDFGIARWTGRQSATVSGVILGTVSYMAPEQTVRSRVDARADLWALGVVLYQMLSGKLPFESATLGEALATISGPEPADLSVLPPAPASLRKALQRLLQKDLDKRCQTATEAVASLEAVSLELNGARPTVGRLRWGGFSRWVAVAATVAAVAGGAWFAFGRGSGPPPKVVPFTFYLGDEVSPAISPDGRQIAYAGQGKDGRNPFEIYVQSIGSTEPLRLTHPGADFEDHHPDWNPSGDRLAFLRFRKGERFGRLMIVPAPGGTEMDLGVDRVLDGWVTWNGNGGSVAFTTLNSAGDAAIFELQLQDRSLRQRTFPARGQSDCCPQFDRNGRRIAFRRNEVEISVTGEEPVSLPVRASWPGLAWSADGRSLFYSWHGRLASVDLAGKSRVRSDLELGANISDPNIRGTRLAFVRWEFQHSIWKLELGRPAGPQAPLIQSTFREDTPQFSPDGRSIAFASERSGSGNIWIGSRDGSSARPLTHFDGQNAGTPRWSPDGKSVVFDLRAPSQDPEIDVQPVAGGEPRRLVTPPGGADVPSYSQDGQWIYFHSRSDDQIWKTPAAGGKAARVTQAGGFEGFESANGSSLYYSKSTVPGIWRLDIASGRESPVPELADVGAYRQWAVAPTGIYFVPNSESKSDEPVIRLFDFASRRIARVAKVGKLVTAGPGALAVSKDETAVLYVHSDRDNRDIMLVEHFR
jgi:Tol biopolymer transport system component